MAQGAGVKGHGSRWGHAESRASPRNVTPVTPVTPVTLVVVLFYRAEGGGGVTGRRHAKKVWRMLRGHGVTGVTASKSRGMAVCYA